MLSDGEITRLKTDKKYIKLIKAGANEIGSDIVKSANGEFRIDLTFWLQFSHKLFLARVIRKELATVSDTLMCNLLNYELNWSDEKYSIESICDCSNQGYVWMRYAEPQVHALFLACERLLLNPSYRDLIKNYSTIKSDKNVRLSQMLTKLKSLHDDTICSIQTYGILNNIVEMHKRDFFRKNKEKIKEKIQNSSHAGYLGIIAENNPGEAHE